MANLEANCNLFVPFEKKTIIRNDEKPSHLLDKNHLIILTYITNSCTWHHCLPIITAQAQNSYSCVIIIPQRRLSVTLDNRYVQVWGKSPFQFVILSRIRLHAIALCVPKLYLTGLGGITIARDFPAKKKAIRTYKSKSNVFPATRRHPRRRPVSLHTRSHPHIYIAC